CCASGSPWRARCSTSPAKPGEGTLGLASAPLTSGRAATSEPPAGARTSPGAVGAGAVCGAAGKGLLGEEAVDSGAGGEAGDAGTDWVDDADPAEADDSPAGGAAGSESEAEGALKAPSPAVSRPPRSCQARSSTQRVPLRTAFLASSPSPTTPSAARCSAGATP